MAHRFHSWVSALAALVLAAPAVGAPKVLALYPVGGQRGTTVSATLEGEGLKELSGFLPLGKGLTAQLLPGGDDKKRTVKISIAADAPLGRQEVRFYDASGISNVRSFAVGALPEVLEAEPNNTPDKVKTLALPTTINGRLNEYTELDGFRFSGKKGETLVCEIEGLRVLGQVDESWLKGYLEIQDSAGKVLVASQGTVDDYYRWDPLLVFTPPADGLYTIWFRDLNWRGSARSVYRLSIGALPHATAVFPLGGRRGTSVPVRFSGPNLSPDPLQVAVPMDATDPIPVALTCPRGTTNERPFQPSDFPEVLQSPDNRALDRAQAVAFPDVVNGQLTPAARDFYRFKLDKKQSVQLEVYSRRIGTQADPELWLMNARGDVLQIDDDSRGGRDPGFLRELDAGEYVVAVRDVEDRGGPEFGYRLYLTAPRPALRCVSNPDVLTGARGATVTVNIHVDRLDSASGPVTVTLLDPPSGVSAAALTLAADKADGQLTVALGANVPLGPLRLRVQASAGTLVVRGIGNETYNIQGTAFQRETVGPWVLVTEKKP